MKGKIAQQLAGGGMVRVKETINKNHSRLFSFLEAK
jgi:hypothetical protein